MDTFAAILETVVRPFTWALVHFVWQGSLIAGLLAAVLFLLRHRPASVRYHWACGAMALMVILPVITVGILLNEPPLGPAPSSGGPSSRSSSSSSSGAAEPNNNSEGPYPGRVRTMRDRTTTIPAWAVTPTRR